VASTANVRQMPQQLSLIAGGATVDTSTIGSIKWGAETRDLDGQFQKGDDVAVALVARVVKVEFEDKYDAHGNVTETIRRHTLRKIAEPAAFTVAPTNPDADGPEA
jgi:hypothetical protein